MNYQEARKRKEELKKLHEHNEQENAKRKLVKDIEKHIRTVMIGALAQFEVEFGVYWGHGKEKENLDTEEAEDRQRWEKVRTAILNAGNGKIRAAADDISKYTVSPPQYNVTFVFDNKE